MSDPQNQSPCLIIEGVVPFNHPRTGRIVTIHGRILFEGNLRIRKGDAIVIEGNGKRIETVIGGFIHIHYADIRDRPLDRFDFYVLDLSNVEIEPGMIITKADT